MPDPRFSQHFSSPNPAAGGGPFPSDFGYAAWSEPPIACVTAGAGAVGAGQLALRRFSVPASLSIATVWINVVTAIGTPTANQNFIGVWDGTGQLCGLSADQSASGFAATGLQGINLQGASGIPGPPASTDTLYIYVGFWWNGATAPFLARTTPLDVNMMNGSVANPISNARCLTAQSGLTTIATTPTQLASLAKNNSLNGQFWCAVS